MVHFSWYSYPLSKKNQNLEDKEWAWYNDHLSQRTCAWHHAHLHTTLCSLELYFLEETMPPLGIFEELFSYGPLHPPWLCNCQTIYRWFKKRKTLCFINLHFSCSIGSICDPFFCLTLPQSPLSSFGAQNPLHSWSLFHTFWIIYLEAVLSIPGHLQSSQRPIQSPGSWSTMPCCCLPQLPQTAPRWIIWPALVISILQLLFWWFHSNSKYCSFVEGLSVCAQLSLFVALFESCRRCWLLLHGFVKIDQLSCWGTLRKYHYLCYEAKSWRLKKF